ncbi:MAG: uracil-DNA glycosylase family protein [Syntrophobacteraceae bacterium]
MPDETCRELAACLERLRWNLAGARAGGIAGWSRASQKGAEAEAGPPPVAAESRSHPEPGQTSVAAESRFHPVPGPTPSAGASRSHPEAGVEGRGTGPGRAEPGDREAALGAIGRSLSGCSRCRLHTGRTNLVFGEGSVRGGVVFVGEGPGFDEDRQGRPFVGRAGRLLDKMIQAMGYARSDVYICNVVKCRPPENRTPLPDEIAACSPFLIKQIEALKPRVICALGACASHSLLQSQKAISQLRGKTHLWRGIPLICTYHPAYLLRNPAQKAATWQDLKQVLKLLHPDP